MKDPRAMSCATLWDEGSCPSEEVSSKAFDMRLAHVENGIPGAEELLREVDHICQACEVYEPIEGT